jgi:hypothetical protein
MRRTVVGLAAVALCCWWMAGSAGFALAATVPPGCENDRPITVRGNIGSEPNVSAPGAVATMSGSLNNGGDLTDATIRIQLVPPSGRSGPTPSVSWQIDGGTSHAIGLSWTTRPAPEDSYWLTSTLTFGALSAGTHTLKVRASFKSGDASGMYAADVYFGAASCGDNLGDGLFDAAYSPRSDGGTGGTAKSGGGTTGRPTPTPARRTPASHISAPAATSAPTLPSTAATTDSPPVRASAAPSGSAGPLVLTTSRSEGQSWLTLSVITIAVLLVVGGAGTFGVRRSGHRIGARRLGRPVEGDTESST